jgi:hypothetical protein
VSFRTKPLVDQSIWLQETINTCKENPEFEPVVINNKGLDDYIDWVAEKWLLPKNKRRTKVPLTPLIQRIKKINQLTSLNVDSRPMEYKN